MLIISPLRVPKSKNKDFILNLNNYRNAHYQTLNKAKVEYKNMVEDQVTGLPVMKRIQLNYQLFPKTARKTDIGNVIAIHKKFFEDALVEFGKLPDDNYEHVLGSSETFGEIDKINPRVEISILIME